MFQRVASEFSYAMSMVSLWCRYGVVTRLSASAAPVGLDRQVDSGDLLTSRGYHSRYN